ncbi:hypothetical protein [Pectobacterium odoriferum]|uniref:hypothetical protein n=1 Tax=Pectobacterium odoriferum TaxID=78398 RepID=UPI0011AF9141|nr:hypothetical protein [Pectobacterium odoriferum]
MSTSTFGERTWFLEDSAQEKQPVAAPRSFSPQSAFLYPSFCDDFNTERTTSKETIYSSDKKLFIRQQTVHQTFEHAMPDYFVHPLTLDVREMQ